MMTPNIWKKSTRSGPWTDNCVEVQWRKSSLSLTNASCVEVAGDPDDGVLVRDTKNREGGTQRYTRAEWRAFVEGVKLGEFDI